MSSSRLASGIAIVVIALSIAGPVEAQGWLADRDRAEGPGIRLGDFELHPGLGAEIGYDSNLYYTSDNPDPALPQRLDSAILRITPHLLFSTIGPERRQEGEGQGGELPDVQFRGGLSASYYEFFNDPDRRNVSIDFGLNLAILQGRPVSFTLFNQFGRTIRPFTENTVSRASTARISEEAGVNVAFSTSGQVLQVGVGYRFGLDFFEASEFQYANNFSHVISLTESFRFLPQTAIVHETNVAIRDYYQPPSSSDGLRPYLRDGVRLSSMLGLNGAITNEVSLLGLVGYGAGFFEGTTTYDQDYDAFLARAELRWRPTEQWRFALGYDRSANASFVGNYYTQDRGYFNGQLVVDGAFLIGAEASVAYYDFGQIVAADGVTPIGRVDGALSTERTDIRVVAEIYAEYRFTEWLALTGTLRYSGSFTDFEYLVPTGPALPVVPDPASYNKFEAWLGVRVFY